MSIRINFGAGGCRIDGWRNTDFCYPDGDPDKIDCTKPLPFADASVDIAVSEMLLEHITPQQAWSFLDELYRIVKPGGLVRITIPDFSLTWRLKDPDYARVNGGVTGATTWKEHCRSIIFCHGHQGLWNSPLLKDVLEAIGFQDVRIQRAGESDRPELRDLEQHWHSVGKACAYSESGCVEGMR